MGNSFGSDTPDTGGGGPKPEAKRRRAFVQVESDSIQRGGFDVISAELSKRGWDVQRFTYAGAAVSNCVNNPLFVGGSDDPIFAASGTFIFFMKHRRPSGSR